MFALEKENPDILSHGECVRSSESEDCEIKQTRSRNNEQSTTAVFLYVFWMWTPRYERSHLADREISSSIP